MDSYQQTKASGNRVLGLLDEHGSLPDSRGDVELDDVTGRVAFDGVTVAYEGEDEPALRDLSFEADAGEMVGEVGPTEAGTSTVVKRLLRFYDVSEFSGSDGTSGE